MDGREYAYHLVATQPNGASDMFGPIVAHALAIPRNLAITSLAPNPARGALHIEYSLPRSGWVRVQVLDVQGRVVARLVEGPEDAGVHQAVWPVGSTRPRAAGLFFVRVEADHDRVTRCAVIAR